jgi:hypothetical protein
MTPEPCLSFPLSLSGWLTPLVGIHEFALRDASERAARERLKFFDEHAVDRRARMEFGVRICRESNGHELVEPGCDRVRHGSFAVGHEANTKAFRQRALNGVPAH